eukprot:198190_1
MDKENELQPLSENSNSNNFQTKINEMEQLKEQIDELQMKNKDLENYKTLMEEYNEIKPIGNDDSMLYSEQLQELQNEIVDRDSIINDLNNANMKIQKMSEKINTLNTNIKHKNLQIKSLNININQQKQQIESVTTNQNEYQEQIRQQVHKLQSDLIDRNNEIQDYAKKYNFVKNTNTIKDKEIKNKIQQIEKLKHSINDKDNKIESIEKK